MLRQIVKNTTVAGTLRIWTGRCDAWLQFALGLWHIVGLMHNVRLAMCGDGANETA
jgi:hypothetical protein